MKRKFEQWLSKIPSIYFNKANNINSLNINKTTAYDIGNPRPVVGQAHKYDGVKPGNGIITLTLTIQAYIFIHKLTTGLYIFMHNFCVNGYLYTSLYRKLREKTRELQLYAWLQSHYNNYHTSFYYNEIIFWLSKRNCTPPPPHPPNKTYYFCSLWRNIWL